MVPQSRSDFKKFVLRKLGQPVIKVNVDDEQVEDRIDEAMKWFADYSSDGSQHVYYKAQITQDMIDTGNITMPDNIFGVIGIFDISSSLGQGGIFNIQYQIALNDLYTLTSQPITPYFMAFQRVGFLQDLLIGRQSIRYNRHENVVHLDMDWVKVNLGEYLIIEAYQVLDPSLFPNIWSDRWLQRYSEALVGQQWGTNLTKFVGVTMPGGTQFNGTEILNRYTTMRQELEHEMINSWSEPVSMFMD
jgi:hypothetical protein